MLITCLLLLAGAGWWFYQWWGKPYLAAQKWAAEKQRYIDRKHAEADTARAVQWAEDNKDRLDADNMREAVMYRAAELKRMRKGENLIYDDMRERKGRR